MLSGTCRVAGVGNNRVVGLGLGFSTYLTPRSRCCSEYLANPLRPNYPTMFGTLWGFEISPYANNTGDSQRSRQQRFFTCSLTFQR